MANNVFDMQDYNKLVKEVKKANQRIERIESRYGESSWAIRYLYDKLDTNLIKGISPVSGKVTINKNMSDIQLRAIQKAVDTFNSKETKTSTLKGINQVIKETKESLAATLGDETHRISDSDINKLYDLVEDREKRNYTERMGASQVWNTLVEAKETGVDMNKFMSLIDKRTKADINNIDDREFLEYIYNEYVK